jgi:hypothetical protein
MQNGGTAVVMGLAAALQQHFHRLRLDPPLLHPAYGMLRQPLASPSPEADYA